MTTAATRRQQINDLLDSLSLKEHERVLRFLQAIEMQATQGTPAGIPGKELVEFFHRFPPETVEAAEEAYEVYRREHELEAGMIDSHRENPERAG
jgi:hypothetical protein